MAVGQAVPAPAGSASIGALVATAPLSLEVVMAPRDPAALDAFLAEVYDPSSPDYHHFLAKGQFGPMFGAAPSTIAEVASELASLGLSPGQVDPDDLVLPVTTTAAVAESAFGVQIGQYRLASGAVAYTNTSAPQVPATIAPFLVGVLGSPTSPPPSRCSFTVPRRPRPALLPGLLWSLEPARRVKPGSWPNGSSRPVPCTQATTEQATSAPTRPRSSPRPTGSTSAYTERRPGCRRDNRALRTGAVPRRATSRPSRPAMASAPP